MIIITTIDTDESTRKVIDWLYSQNKKYYIINQLSKFKLDTIHIPLKENIAPEVTSYWFRQGSFMIDTPIVNIPNISSKKRLQEQLQDEAKILSHFVRDQINNVNGIGDEKTSNVNKLNILQMAFEEGLNIPSTIITTSKIELTKFKRKYKIIVSKPISEAAVLIEKNYAIMNYTSTIDDTSILPDYFFPTLFQEAINKLYELRIFYLNGKCYSCAIFSQLDNKTKNDFRNYNKQKPNRFVPYKLSKDLEIKINNLMKRLRFNSGSIDMLVNKEKDVYFLEVNPVGQFGMVSIPCNYNLYKIIANNLI